MNISFLLALACSMSSAFGGLLDGLTAGLTSGSSPLSAVSGLTSGSSPLSAVSGLTSGSSPLSAVSGLTSGSSPLSAVSGLTSGSSPLSAVSGLTSGSSPLSAVSGLTSGSSPLNVLGGLTGGGSPVNVLTNVGATVTGSVTGSADSSSLLSPVTNILDGIIGGTDGDSLLSPVTGAVGDLLDTVDNLVDGLLGGNTGSQGSSGSKGPSGSKGSSGLTDVLGSLIGGVKVDGSLLQTVSNLLGGCGSGSNGLGKLINDLITLIKRIIKLIDGIKNSSALKEVRGLLNTLQTLLGLLIDVLDDLNGMQLSIVGTNLQLLDPILGIVGCVIETLADILKNPKLAPKLSATLTSLDITLSYILRTLIYVVGNILYQLSCSPKNVIVKLVQLLGTTIGCFTSILQGGLSFALYQMTDLLKQNSLASNLSNLFYCISYYLSNILSNLGKPLIGLFGSLTILPTPAQIICSLINNLIPQLICVLGAGPSGFLSIV